MKEIVYISENLKYVLENCNEQEKFVIFKNLEHFENEYEQALKKYDALSCAVTFQEFIQEIIDENLKKFKKETNKEILCKKGCGFCCHLHTDITKEEAKLLVEYCESSLIEINWDRLKIQSEKSQETWKELNPKDKRCVFLNDEIMSCKVYRYRPISCRKHLVISEPKLCDIENNTTEQILKVNTIMAEIVATAIYSITETNSMSKQLMKFYVEDDPINQNQVFI